MFVSRDIFIDEDTPPRANHNSTSMEVPPDNNLSTPTYTEEHRTFLEHQSSSSPLDHPQEPSPHHTPQPTAPPSPTLSEPVQSEPAQDSVSSSTLPPPQIFDTLRRSDRIRRFPHHLQDFVAHIELDDHSTEVNTDHLIFQQVHLLPHWQKAMRTEFESIRSNNTWTLVPLPPGKRAISSRWVYKIKPSVNGSPTRYKARLVARGFEQQDGIDFLDTFAPVVRWEPIRILIAVAIHLNWPIHQLDVLTAFLNGILQEEVYMRQPLGFVTPGTDHLVCKLHKSLYGLRQSPRAWYARLHIALLA